MTLPNRILLGFATLPLWLLGFACECISILGEEAADRIYTLHDAIYKKFGADD